MSFDPYLVPQFDPTQTYQLSSDQVQHHMQQGREHQAYLTYDPGPPDAFLSDAAMYGALGAFEPQLHQPMLPRHFNPEEHTRVSPSQYDPSRFSPTTAFAVPRFASAVPETSLSGFVSGSMMPPPPVPRPSSISQHENPVYDAYGSSVVSIGPAAGSLKLSGLQQSIPSSPSAPFNPAQLGLPIPPDKPTNFAGLYSTSGLDLLGIFARVTGRPNPEIQLGPVDLGCSFLVTDPRQPDNPIVYASDTFSALTGYDNSEILGRNCRFLQSPDGLVSPGAKRHYTDGNAVYHLKRFITTGRESQASLINYRKGGEPFINLITVIPVSWDSDEIAYFVGFQVNLVDQPSSIMSKMRNGTYIVNYALVGTHEIYRAPSTLLESMEVSDDSWAPLSLGGAPEMGKAAYQLELPTTQEMSSELLDVVQAGGVHALKDERARKQFNQLLLDQCEDFVHVVSLKGTLLYVSPSAHRLLEYAPGELTGKTLSSICHPSDIVAVLRELKDSGTTKDAGVHLLYRVRRKYSGYIWLASSGKLHVEPGKARKAIILVGRQQKVYQVSWADLERAGGICDTEYWAKYSLRGMLLYSTPSVEGVLGFTAEELMGSTVAKYDEGGALLAAIRGVAQAQNPSCTSVHHTLRGKTGPVEVVTNFYPSHAVSSEPASPTFEGVPPEKSFTVIAQTVLASSDLRKRRSALRPRSSSSTSTGNTGGPPSVAFALPTNRSNSSDGDGSDHGSSHSDRASGEESGSGSSGSSTSFSAVPSTFKTLSTSASDNIFDELEVTRGTSWQFELHQLRLVNRKLREEKATLATLLQRKKRKRAALLDPRLATTTSKSSEGGDSSRTGGEGSVPSRRCANCGRGASAEWRSGPTGPKTLCNACGLRWAKATRDATIAAGSATSPSASPVLRPTSLFSSGSDSGSGSGGGGGRF